MAQLNKGTTYSTGDQVTAANLNAHVDNAVLLPGAINDQIAASALTTSDSVLLSQSIGLRKATIYQLGSLFSYLRADGSVPMATGQQLTLGTTSQIAPLDAVSLGHLQANYVSSSVGLDAKVTFNGLFSAASIVTFTYTRVDDIVTVTCNNHGFSWQNVAYFDFTSVSGTAIADGDYFVSLIGLTANSFQIDLGLGVTATGSGTGVFRRCAVWSSSKVSQVCPRGTSAGNGYWVNLNYTYYQFAQMLPLVSISNANQGTAAYSVIDKYVTKNAGAGSRTDSAICFQTYATGGTLVDSGSYTGVVFTGGSIRP